MEGDSKMRGREGKGEENERGGEGVNTCTYVCILG